MKKAKSLLLATSLPVYMIPFILIWGIILLAYWPGILVSDSMFQWNQVQTGNFDNWHPAYNTLYIYLLTRICNSPAFVLFVQIIILSFCIASFMRALEKYYSVNRFFLFSCSIILAIIPLNFNSAVILLKDTLYSAFLILLSAITIEIVNSTTFFDSSKKPLKLFFVLLLIALFRHNGIIVVILYSVTVGIVFRKHIGRIFLIGLTVTIVYLIMTTIGFSLLGISEGNYSNKYAPVSHLLARMLNTPGVEFTVSELELMQEYVDVVELRDSFNPYNMDYSIATQNVTALKESGEKYLIFGLRKALQYPILTIKHYLILDSFLYSPIPFPGSYVVGMFTETDLWEYKTVYPDLAENSKIPWLLRLIKAISNWYQNASIGNLRIEYFTMRPAIYFYASLVIIVYLSRKKRESTLWCIILPTAFNLVSLAPAMPVSMTRYVYSTILIGYLLIAWFVYEIYESKHSKLLKR